MLIKKSCIIFLISFFFLTCKIDKNLAFLNEDTSSLKESLNNTLLSIEWAEEIEPDILYTSKNESTKETSKSNPIIKAETLFLLNTRQSKPLYPFIENFGSLDTKNLNPQSRALLEAFLKNISQSTVSKNTFSPQASYLSIVFADFLEEYPKPESWIFGESTPLFSELDHYLEVPVKVYAKKDTKKVSYVLTFFLLQDDENPLIEQVQIGNIRYE